MREIAQWMQRNGLPFDYAPDEQPPDELYVHLVYAWEDAEGEDLESWAWSIAQETGWDDIGDKLREQRLR